MHASKCITLPWWYFTTVFRPPSPITTTRHPQGPCRKRGAHLHWRNIHGTVHKCYTHIYHQFTTSATACSSANADRCTGISCNYPASLYHVHCFNATPALVPALTPSIPTHTDTHVYPIPIPMSVDSFCCPLQLLCYVRSTSSKPLIKSIWAWWTSTQHLCINFLLERVCKY